MSLSVRFMYGFYCFLLFLPSCFRPHMTPPWHLNFLPLPSYCLSLWIFPYFSVVQARSFVNQLTHKMFLKTSKFLMMFISGSLKSLKLRISICHNENHQTTNSLHVMMMDCCSSCQSSNFLIRCCLLMCSVLPLKTISEGAIANNASIIHAKTQWRIFCEVACKRQDCPINRCVPRRTMRTPFSHRMCFVKTSIVALFFFCSIWIIRRQTGKCGIYLFYHWCDVVLDLWRNLMIFGLHFALIKQIIRGSACVGNWDLGGEIHDSTKFDCKKKFVTENQYSTGSLYGKLAFVAASPSGSGQRQFLSLSNLPSGSICLNFLFQWMF